MKKITFKKKINLFEEFKTGTVKTRVDEVPVNTTTVETPAAEIRSEAIKDVNSILNNLETLSVQIGEAREFIYGFIDECHTIITEELAKEEPNDETINTVLEAYMEVLEDLEVNEQLNEAGEDKVGKKMWNFIWWAPKARKAQEKVNKIKLNKKALDLAADNAPNKEQAEKLEAKAARVKTQIDDLQKQVDDRFSDKGEYVKGVMKKTKLKGQLELIKQETGMSDDPSDKAELKDQAREIQAKYKEEEQILKELEPSEEDKKAAADQIQAEKEEQERLRKEAKARRDAKRESGGYNENTQLDGSGRIKINESIEQHEDVKNTFGFKTSSIAERFRKLM